MRKNKNDGFEMQQSDMVQQVNGLADDIRSDATDSTLSEADENEPNHQEWPGRLGPIGPDQIKKASEVLQKYKDGKANLEQRIIENEQWWKLRHWEYLRNKHAGDKRMVEPTSGWLFNSIANKHADAMDNFPEPNVLPREASDRMAAQSLSKIIPVVLEHNEFESTYSDTWWYKLKAGTGVYGIFWNPRLENGLGDVDIRQIDILNIFWEPGVKDIQRSRNFFHVELVDNDLLEVQYPFLKGKVGTSSIEVAKYVYDDQVDTTDKSAVIDWYYKSAYTDDITGAAREVVHYVKYVDNEIIYASENDESIMESGFYEHGKYPFVFDTLFVEEGTPCGFGYIDVMKNPQLYIDKLDQGIITSALQGSKPRFFVKDSSNINEEEFADWNNDFIHVAGALNEDNIKQIAPVQLGSIFVEVRNNKIDELKETSGNRDFSQGSTTSGVTAASAIAALQEAGSKLSRDMIKSSYRAFTKINYFVIELIRQFYDEPRSFRITGEQGQTDFVNFDNTPLKMQPQGDDFGLDLGYRRPVFDIKVTSQKSSPFSKISQNELAKELYGMGFFNPQLSDQALAALQMMDFEGKSMIEQKVAQNGTLFMQVQQLQEQVAKMALLIDNAYGTQTAQPATMAAQQPLTGRAKDKPSDRIVDTNALGKANQSTERTLTNQYKERVAKSTMPD